MRGQQRGKALSAPPNWPSKFFTLSSCARENSAHVTLSRRANAETVSQRTLEALCNQMQCKGLLLLGEILEDEADEDREVFLSM